MSDSSRGKKPLVADRRYSKKAAAKKKPAGKTKRRKATRTPRRGGIVGFFRFVIGWVLRLIWKIVWRTGVLVAIVLGLLVGYNYTSLPPVEKLLDGRARGSVTLLDRDGAVFAWRGDQYGGAVTADSVSPHLKNAVIATEDKRFYRHFGVSPRGIASAVRINLSEGRGPLSGHGGSTITQQTAKLLCLGREFDPAEWKSEKEYVADCRRGSVQRKAEEAIYALAMELKYSKNEILSIYLNRAYFGGGAYGAEAATQRYFGKPANAANPAEAAMLAGLLTAPSALAPTSDIERSQARAATVLRLMREQGYISAAQEQTFQDNPATLSEAAEKRAGGYFADWVMSDAPEFFTTTTADVVIRTTLDQRLQEAAEAGVKKVFDEKVRPGSKAQAAVVVMSADGAVRAMVGGRKTKVSGAFNRAVQAKRQTGSAFKPFVYAAALDLGYSPLDTVVDEPYCLNIPGSGEWCPRNYTNRFSGPVTVAEALRESLNIPAVKISEAVGRDLVRQVAAAFGLDSDLAAGPALALGASESTLLNMTGAYAGILNGGSAVKPYGLVELRMAGDDAPLMEATGGIQERVIQQQAAQQLVWMMEKVVSEGTGARAQFGGWQIAGKTGTTQAARDAWFVGFTADYVAGVWMGYDDNTPLTGVTGGGLPAEIWREVMIGVHDGLAPQPLPMMGPSGPSGEVLYDEGRPPPISGQGGAQNILNQVLNDIFGGGGGGGGGAPAPSGADR
ncbi:PBP1A family penicillin-binding protein [Aliishimia ponticola]|uniref:peptidoglycan glycosyltransferase n=1 Tax=Aliishimia ponticola TaxID=2499833 RepID=A0A4S4NA51_9RHOB|nr:PBP1A family penicillin-binding protein [Aliishimia ponticola]THH36162.1 PBP1A family penicillin-binding protein [Aliishimia ponticola]